MKKWISSLLAMNMVFGMAVVPGFAAGRDGAEFDERAEITGASVASYAAAPDAFVDDADSDISGVFQTGLTAYVITDNGAPSGQAYTAGNIYDASAASNAARIDPEKSFNSYLCYRDNELDGVLFVQNDADSLWRSVVASMLDGLEIEDLTLPQSVAEVEAAYDRQLIGAADVAEVAAAPGDACVSDLDIFVLTNTSGDSGSVYNRNDPYVVGSDTDIVGADFASFLCYEKRALSGLMFVQDEIENKWVLDAARMTEDMHVEGFQEAIEIAFDKVSTAGSVVEAMAKEPDMLPIGDMNIFVINSANRSGLTYTSEETYVSADADINNTAAHIAYMCYRDGVPAGILFVESGVTGWESSVRSLIGDMTIKNASLPRQYPVALNCAIHVKESADEESVRKAAFRTLVMENRDYPIDTISWGRTDFSESGIVSATVEYTNGEMATVIFSVGVEPAQKWNYTSKMDAVDALSDHNLSDETLLKYVNSDLEITPVVEGAYAEALGTAIPSKVPAFTWDQSNVQYNPRGGLTYTFTQMYDGMTFTRTIEVKPASTDAPVVEVNYRNSTVNTTERMKWSLDQELDPAKWYNCSNDMGILKDWYGETVYFIYPESDHALQSKVSAVKIPDCAVEPQVEPDLSATSHSVTILNCADYDDAEYSLDGINWYQPDLGTETFTFFDLNPETMYTVRVRTCAWDSIYLASPSVHSSIYTTEKVETTSNLSYHSPTAEQGVITMDVAPAPEIVDKTLIGTLSENLFSKMVTVISKYLRSYDDVQLKLNISQVAEAGETMVDNGFKLTLPYSVLKNAIDKGTTTVCYKNDNLSFILGQNVLETLSGSSRTFTFETHKLSEAPSASVLKWVKEQYNAGSEVYRLNYRCDRKDLIGTEMLIPVEPDANVKSYNVYHVTPRGVSSEITASYNLVDKGVNFCYAGDGYYVLKKNTLAAESENPNQSTAPIIPSTPMNFSDVPASFWGYSGIKYCYDRGIMVGISDNNFAPGEYLSKGQIVTMLARLAGADLTERVTSTGFSDVTPESWYAAAAKWVKDNNIVTTSSFNGDKALTRQGIAEMLYAYMTGVEGLTVDPDTAQSAVPYKDASEIHRDYRDAVDYVRYMGIMHGVGDNSFDPAGGVTRAQMATMAMRLNTLLENMKNIEQAG